VKESQEALKAMSNVPGLTVTAATGGNIKAGQVTATLADAATLAVAPMQAVKNPATAADAIGTVGSVADLVINAGKTAASVVSGAIATSPQPPPPPPPKCPNATCPNK
jgi:hypothetical protein